MEKSNTLEISFEIRLKFEPHFQHTFNQTFHDYIYLLRSVENNKDFPEGRLY